MAYSKLQLVTLVSYQSQFSIWEWVLPRTKRKAVSKCSKTRKIDPHQSLMARSFLSWDTVSHWWFDQEARLMSIWDCSPISSSKLHPLSTIALSHSLLLFFLYISSFPVVSATLDLYSKSVCSTTASENSLNLMAPGRRHSLDLQSVNSVSKRPCLTFLA